MVTRPTPASNGGGTQLQAFASGDGALRLPNSITEAGRRLRNGEFTAEDLTRVYLDRIRMLQPKLNALITVTEEHALASAAQLDREMARGLDRGPLHGIPVVYKDNIDTQGIATTVGSALFRHRVPTEDAAIVRRLAQAGMIMLGKANMSEFASGSSGINVNFGNVHNPWDLARAPGGSSSGTGAAVAADMCMAGIGTDAGGSIRQPSSRCGIFGLRPTFGRVSLAGVWPRTRTLGVAGPMTRCVEDAALMLNALAGFDPQYVYSLRAPMEDYTAELRRGIEGLKLGIIDGYTFNDIDPQIETVLRAAIDVLASLGAEILTVKIPELTGALEYSSLFSNVLLFEFNEILGEQYRGSDKSLFGPAVHADIARGAGVAPQIYHKIQTQRTTQAATVKRVFADVDALLAPVLPNVTPLQTAGPEVWARGRQFNLPFSFIGAPSVSVPCGFAAGMPVGLQVVADDLKESRLLRIAAAFEAATEHHLRRPPALD